MPPFSASLWQSFNPLCIDDQAISLRSALSSAQPRKYELSALMDIRIPFEAMLLCSPVKITADHFLRRKMLPVTYTAPQCPNAPIQECIRGQSVRFDRPALNLALSCSGKDSEMKGKLTHRSFSQTNTPLKIPPSPSTSRRRHKPVNCS